MIVFGWGGGKPKNEGDVAPLACPNCEKEVFFQHVSSTKWFRLYFIPLIPYDSKHFLLCPVCTRGAQLSRTQRESVARMKGTTASWLAQTLSDAAYASEVRSFWVSLFPAGEPAAIPGSVEPRQTGAVELPPPPEGRQLTS